jgi:hypothetical protein
MAQAQLDQIKKERKIDPIMSELKKNYPVQVVNGARVFLSQSSAKPTARRYGVPIFDKKKTTLKQLRGCFADLKEVIDWLAKKKASGEIDAKRYDEIVTDVTKYVNMKEDDPLLATEEYDLGIYAELVQDKPKKPKAEKKEPARKSVNTTADKSAPAAPSSKSTGGYVVIGGDAVMEDVDPETAPKLKKLHESVFHETGGLQRVELIIEPTAGVVLYKKLENPSAAALKILAKAVGCPVEQFKLDKGAARDGKYNVVMRTTLLKSIRKEKQKQKAEKTKKVEKQKKVAAARDIKPVSA